MKLKDRGADGWERRGVKTAASSTSLLHSSNLSLRQQAGGREDRTPKQVCYQQQPLADVKANAFLQKAFHQGCTIDLKCIVIMSCDHATREYRREQTENIYIQCTIPPILALCDNIFGKKDGASLPWMATVHGDR